VAPANVTAVDEVLSNSAAALAFVSLVVATPLPGPVASVSGSVHLAALGD